MDDMPAHDPESTDPLQPTDRDLDAESPAGEPLTPDETGLESDAINDEAPTEVPARVARQARMGRFLGLGAIVGLLVALVLTMLWPDNPGFEPDNPMLEFTDMQVFGFLAVYLVPICLGLFGLLGYILGRVAEKRSRTEVVMARVESPADSAETDALADHVGDVASAESPADDDPDEGRAATH